MRKILTLCFLMVFPCLLQGYYYGPSEKQEFITATKRIYIPEYPGAQNPSLLKFNDGYILTFRHMPNRHYHHWVSYIGIMLLDKDFEPVSAPQLLDTRFNDKRTSSQSEDARIFSMNGKLYLIYNDSMELECPAYWERRDMYLAELFFEDDHFFLSDPIKLVFGEKYRLFPWQKNWTPFVYDGELYLSYSINPHVVVKPDLITGECKKCYDTSRSFHWPLGELLGGTPSILVDGEYLTFFHSKSFLESSTSEGREMWHYFMGACTFSNDPPFQMTSISKEAVDILGFYTYTLYEKRVIYPSGLVEDGNTLYLAYGKNDYEVWIATIDLAELKKTMVPVK